MADNVNITSGSGVVIATDDDGSAQHQWVKIEIGDNGSFVPVTTANGLPVQILSLPAFAVGSIMSVSGLTSAVTSLSPGTIVSVSGLTSAITSLSPGTIVSISGLSSAITSLSAGTIISISGLTSATVSIGAGSIMSISGLTSAIVSISNLPISVMVESLPALGVGTIVSVSGLTSAVVSLSAGSIISVSGLTSASVSVSNLASTLLSVNAINITSLPPLGAGTVSISPISLLCTVTAAGIFRITSLPPLGAATVSISPGSAVTISNLASVPLTFSGTTIALAPHANYFYFSSTYTAALTTGTQLKALPGSTSAYVITDDHFACGETHGDMSLVYSRSNAAIVTLIPDTYFTNYAGMVSNLNTPLVCDTNSAIHLYSHTCTSQSVFISGYTI